MITVFSIEMRRGLLTYGRYGRAYGREIFMETSTMEDCFDYFIIL